MSLVQPASGGLAADLWGKFNMKKPRPGWAWIDLSDARIVNVKDLVSIADPKPTARTPAPFIITCDNPVWVACTPVETFSCDANGRIWSVKSKMRFIQECNVDSRGALSVSTTAIIALPWSDTPGNTEHLGAYNALSSGEDFAVKEDAEVVKKTSIPPNKNSEEKEGNNMATTPKDMSLTTAMQDAFNENEITPMNNFGEKPENTNPPSQIPSDVKEEDLTPEVKAAAAEAAKRKLILDEKKKIAEDLTKALLSNVSDAPETDKASPGLISGFSRVSRIIGFLTNAPAKTSYKVISKSESKSTKKATSADKAKDSTKASEGNVTFTTKFVQSRPPAPTHVIAEIPQRLESGTVDLLMTDSVIHDTKQWADPIISIRTSKVVLRKVDFVRFLGACIGFSPIKEHDVTAAGGVPSTYAITQTVITGASGTAAGDNELTSKKSTIKLTLKRVSGSNGKSLLHTRNYFPLSTYETFNYATEPQQGEALEALNYGEFNRYFTIRKATEKKPASRTADKWPTAIHDVIRVDENKVVSSNVYAGPNFSEKLETYFDGTAADVTRIPVRTKIKSDGTIGASALFKRIASADIVLDKPDSAWVDPQFEPIRSAAGVALLQESVKSVAVSKANSKSRTVAATPEATSTLFRKAQTNINIQYA